MFDIDHLARKFQLHLTRSHKDTILLCGADTGRAAEPSGVHILFDRGNELEFPTCRTIGSTNWRTRFDGGRAGMNPSTIVAVYIRSELEEDGETPCIAEAWTKILCQQSGRNVPIASVERYFVHAYPGQLKTIESDGLPLFEGVVWACAHVDKKVTDAERTEATRHGWNVWQHARGIIIPDVAKTLLDRAVAHVRNSFGQGGDFFKP